MVGKLNPRGNILVLQRRGKSFMFGLGFLAFHQCHLYSQPLDFPCVIKPRSHHAVELIRSFSGLDLVESE